MGYYERGEGLVQITSQDAVLEAAILEKVERVAIALAQGREVMNAEEAANFLRLSPSEFRKLAAAGVIPRHPVNGKSYRYLRSELIQWVARRL